VKYLITETDEPIHYLSCGQLLSKEGFIHPNRVIDSTVFIIVNEGTLFIAQDDHKYELKKNNFITLYEKRSHWGWKKSSDKLSYFWVHFYLPKKYKYVYSHEHIKPQSNKTEQQKDINSILYVLPETGMIDSNGKLPLLFNQLLDYGSENGGCLKALQKYSLSLLLMEHTREITDSFTAVLKYKPIIIKIQRWIRSNYRKQMSVKQIADIFQYNPDYLSSEFKKQTGFSLSQFINRTRIDIAKNLLTSLNTSVKEAAYSVGFMDEKYFTRIFKKMEPLTPAEYKKAFSNKKILS